MNFFQQNLKVGCLYIKASLYPTFNMGYVFWVGKITHRLEGSKGNLEAHIVYSIYENPPHACS